jgi:phage baseplate assembly protein W
MIGIDDLFSDINARDITKREGLDAIESQIENVITISTYQVPGRPEFASSLLGYLHEPDDVITRGSIETEVEALLENYVDRIIVEDVTCKSISNQMIVIDITYRYKQLTNIKTIEIGRY